MGYWPEDHLNQVSLRDRIGVFVMVHRKELIAIAAIAIVGVLLCVWFLLPRPATLTMIDVGQGDALLLRTRHGQTIVIDAGNNPGYLGKLGQLLGPWDRTIDLLVLTHPHEDHVSGFVDLARRWKVGAVLWTGVEYPAPAYQAFQSWVRSLQPEQLLVANAGQRIDIDGGWIEVVWPIESLQGKVAATDGAEGSGGVNDTSIVLEIHIDGHSMMLSGDVSSVVERTIVSRTVVKPVDIIKVGHHGSRYSTSEQWVEVLKPSIALISVGAKNEFNHPAQSVIGRLREMGTQVYQTSLDGTVSVEFRSDGLMVKTHQ